MDPQRNKLQKAREDPHSYWWYDRNWFMHSCSFIYYHYIEYIICACVSWFRSKQFQSKLFPNRCFLVSSWHLKLAQTRGAEWPLLEDLHTLRRQWFFCYQDLESMHFHPRGSSQRRCYPKAVPGRAQRIITMPGSFRGFFRGGLYEVKVFGWRIRNIMISILDEDMLV